MHDSRAIYIAVHRPGFVPDNQLFKPVHVGAHYTDLKFASYQDNSGENISEKNKNYCELTAQYWVYKNAQPTDIVGFCHYRRYFLNSHTIQHTRYYSENQINDFFGKYDSSFIDSDLKDNDIILLKPFSYYHSVENTLSNIIQKDDLKILENVILKLYPDYISEYRQFMNFNNKISSCNMFITRWDIFESYCAWLFDILFEVEKSVKISGYETPARVFGFLGEALLNVYVLHNKLNVTNRPVAVFRDDVKNDNDLIYMLKEFRRSLSFFFNKPPSRIKEPYD